MSRGKFLSVSEILPRKELKDKSSTMSREERVVGIVPEKLLC